MLFFKFFINTYLLTFFPHLCANGNSPVEQFNLIDHTSVDLSLKGNVHIYTSSSRSTLMIRILYIIYFNDQDILCAIRCGGTDVQVLQRQMHPSG